MITREMIRELASHDSAADCAVSFFYQPTTPKDQSHREEAILLKDLVRQAMHEAEATKPNAFARVALSRILEMADRIHNNQGKAKAIFADASRNIWREFDLPARLASTQLIVNSRFRLKPLAPILEFTPRVCVVLADRTKARLFNYNLGEAREVVGFFNELPRLGETDGWGGYNAGHNQRHLNENVKHHYKRIDDHVMKMFERCGWDSIAFGCRDENWHEIEEVLHTDIKQRSLGHFRIDPVAATGATVVEGVERLLSKRELQVRNQIMEDVVGEARRNGNGAVGLRRVIGALEKGEIQTLLIGDRFEATGVECRNCGHIEFSSNAKCSLCDHQTKQVDDLSDAIIGAALRHGIDIMAIRNDERLEKNGHIAALLRFRSDQNTPMKQVS